MSSNLRQDDLAPSFFKRIAQVAAFILFWIILNLYGPSVFSQIQHKVRRAFFSPIKSITFVSISPEQFVMGSSGELSAFSHPVAISKGFELQTTEVTQWQWEAVMGNNPSFFSSCGDDCPVENVSWAEAQAFIKRMNERNDGHVYSLPTQIEWEYAARAGTTDVYEGKVGKFAWESENSAGTTHPVGKKQANAWGLYDMFGNVSEWVSDEHEPRLPYGVKSAGMQRVFCGGSWETYPDNFGLNLTYSKPADLRSNNRGFRLRRTI